jgi:hypothetical protein
MTAQIEAVVPQADLSRLGRCWFSGEKVWILAKQPGLGEAMRSAVIDVVDQGDVLETSSVPPILRRLH